MVGVQIAHHRCDDLLDGFGISFGIFADLGDKFLSRYEPVLILAGGIEMLAELYRDGIFGRFLVSSCVAG